MHLRIMLIQVSLSTSADDTSSPQQASLKHPPPYGFSLPHSVPPAGNLSAVPRYWRIPGHFGMTACFQHPCFRDRAGSATGYLFARERRIVHTLSLSVQILAYHFSRTVHKGGLHFSPSHWRGLWRESESIISPGICLRGVQTEARKNPRVGI